MIKSELRKLYFQKRLSLKEQEYANFNYQITDQFFSNIDLSMINIIHTYLPIEKNKEPNTWLIIDKIKKEFPAVRISIPRVRNNTLENFFFEGIHQLEKNAWGILEPKEGMPTDVKKIDMVIVPLLIFDENGNRVGYGKGFYDKFLSLCKPSCKKIGFSFFEATLNIDGISQHDIPLDSVITPKGVKHFTPK